MAYRYINKLNDVHQYAILVIQEQFKIFPILPIISQIHESVWSPNVLNISARQINEIRYFIVIDKNFALTSLGVWYEQSIFDFRCHLEFEHGMESSEVENFYFSKMRFYMAN